MKSAFKDIIREILSNKGRFISILSLLFISMIAFNGLYMATKLLAMIPEKLYNTTNLEDVNIVSTLGLDERDEVLLDILPSVRDFEMSNSIDLFSKDDSSIVRLESLNERINIPVLIDGKFPSEIDEIVLGYDYYKDKLKIGDKITFVNKDNSKKIDELRVNSFTVAGFVRSSDYLAEKLNENSSIGNGQLNSYGMVLKNAFDVDYFSKARILLYGTENLNSFKNDYVELVDNEIQNLERSFSGRPSERLKAVKDEANEKIDDAQSDIDDANKKLSDAEQELVDARIKLNDGKREYDDGVIKLRNEVEKGNREIADAKKKLADALVEIEDGKIKIADARKELNEKKAELEDARKKLNDGEKKYNDNYKLYSDGKKELDDFKEKVRVGREWEKGNDRSKLNYEDDFKKEKSEILGKIDSINVNIKNYNSQISYNKEELELNPSDEDLIKRISQLEGYLNTEENTKKTLNSRLTEVENELDTISRIKKEGNENKFVLLGADEYIAEAETELADAKKKLDDAKVELDDAKKEFNDGESKLKDAENTLDEKEKELKDAEVKHSDGVKEVKDAEETMAEEVAKAEKTLEDARIKIADGEKEYADGLKKFEEKSAEARIDLDKGQSDLDKAKEDLSKLKTPKFMINSRNANSFYFITYGAPKSLNVLTIIFSFLALSIALLVALTTMTRMIDERRTLIGTYKGLGYSNGIIGAKFIVFGGVSGILGAILGSIFGQMLIGPVIYEIYNEGMIFDSPYGYYSIALIIVSVFLAIITTSFSAYLATNRTLKSNSALLMRPKTPKAGSRIFLERISLIWNNLGFKNKLTARNIFRYKTRMFMTILGVAGCMGLLMLGFGMKFSISGVLTSQYDEILKYDLSAIFKEEVEPQDIIKIEDYIKSNKNVVNTVPIYQELLKFEIPGQNTVDVVLYVDIDGNLNEAIKLHDVNRKADLTLENNGILITDKLADLMNVTVGSEILLDLEDHEVKAEISGIIENYVGHSIYFSKGYYEKITRVIPSQSGLLIKLNESSKESISNATEFMLDNEDIISVISNESMKENLKLTIDSIDVVIIIIVLISMLLALVVLYNLTNINVSERIRELSTMKVLGFQPWELTEYVYKETFILAIIGIVLGLFLGIALIEFVLTDFAPINAKFGDPNYPITFGISAVLTIIFSVVVMFLMHVKLKKIDMVEALKSVD